MLKGVKKKIIQDGYDVYDCGHYTKTPRIYEFPYSFYDDIKLPREFMKTYFYIPTLKESTDLYTTITAQYSEYIIIHQQSSTKTIDIWTNLSANTSLPILDLNENHYPVGHRYYEIAELAVNKPLLWYKDLMENASELHMIESSLYCMASLLDLSKASVKKAHNTCDNSNLRIGVFDSA